MCKKPVGLNLLFSVFSTTDGFELRGSFLNSRTTTEKDVSIAAMDTAREMVEIISVTLDSVVVYETTFTSLGIESVVAL